jgi:hypothetical protein
MRYIPMYKITILNPRQSLLSTIIFLTRPLYMKPDPFEYRFSRDCLG